MVGSSHAWPVAITSLGRVATATRLWRTPRQLFLTVIVKATFALVPEGAMTLVDPEPMATGEGGGPTDLTPYLERADILFSSIPRSGPAPSARLVVFGDRALVDKRLTATAGPGWGAARSGELSPYTPLSLIHI